ncbi:hypothetical protein OUZ56_009090 [Daphnia magna]|uniref:GMP synthase n=1 Tax=Daphnia magna TaxID=35525 RepID=A0ABR0AF01_9CRUS|nr:hypothetical protein OUZ56_009090 [Daphnia magna]
MNEKPLGKTHFLNVHSFIKAIFLVELQREFLLTRWLLFREVKIQEGKYVPLLAIGSLEEKRGGGFTPLPGADLFLREKDEKNGTWAGNEVFEQYGLPNESRIGLRVF